MTFPVFSAGQTAYNLTNSLRFRSSASASLARTPSSSTNQLTWTWSGWVKRGSFGGGQTLFCAKSGGNQTIFWLHNDQIKGSYNVSSVTQYEVVTSAVFRDPSAWYHIVLVSNLSNATSANRVQIYVNGVLQTITGTPPTQNYANSYINSNIAHGIAYNTADTFFDGYMTEVNFIDGQALTPSSFGQTSSTTGVWQPKKYSGTYGTNGFYLPFTDNSALTSGSNAGLGKDFSGNGNYWNTNNISITSGSTYDSMTDVPTLTSATASNFCVINPLDTNGSSATITEGNLKFANGGTAVRRGTLGLTNTKVYWEFTQSSSVGVGSEINYGSAGLVGNPTHSAFAQGATAYTDNGSNKAFWRTTTAGIVETVTPSSFTVNVNDIIQVAYDGTTGKFWFGKNNTWYDGSGGTTGNPSTGSNPVFTLPDLTNPMTPVFDHAGSAYTTFLNCGQRPFTYTPPTGYVALNTYNLLTPTIGATASSQASKYFNAVTYAGSASSVTVTGVNFQPDFVWTKARTQTFSHGLMDVIRGFGSGATKVLCSNTSNAEFTQSNILSVNSDGFVTGTTGVGETNNAGDNYVAWNWKANGTGVTNTAGSITSTVSANTTSGFSIVTYSGQASDGTVGHGLGVAPKMIIVKNRTTGSTGWVTYHASLPSASSSILYLNTTGAVVTGVGTWNSTAPTSTVFSVDGGDSQVNAGSNNYVAYCFSEVAGFSKFGSYTGNGSSDGPFIYTGFKPKYVMIKATNDISHWTVEDGSRSPYNVATASLYTDTSATENNSIMSLDLLSNGFKCRNVLANESNVNGYTYIYMAFAENPFKYSLAR